MSEWQFKQTNMLNNFGLNTIKFIFMITMETFLSLEATKHSPATIPN